MSTMRGVVSAHLATLVCGLPAASHAGPPCTMGWNPDPIGVPGTSQVVRALVVFDDGAGPALYAGGPFFTAGGVTVNSVAKWDGEAWSALGAGMVGPVPTSAAAVNGLAVHDDGTGAALYAAGNLLQAGGQPANRIARWDGAAWSPLGPGLDQAAQAMASFNDGTGHALYVGGSFTAAAGLPGTVAIARWNGVQWSSVGGGAAAGSVNVLFPYDDGTGAALYAGGTFFTIGNTPGTSRVAKWDGTAWAELGGGMNGPSNPRVNALAVFDDGGGPGLYAGGLFDTAGGQPAFNLASWRAGAWSPVGGGTDNTVIRMLVFNDGPGPALFIGGSFATVQVATPIVVNSIVRWDGEAWDDLDGGVVHPTVTTVSGLAVLDLGEGESLYVAGGFTTAGGQPANNVVRWGCAPCYPDCNESGDLTVADFGCFQGRYVLGDLYADCTGEGTLSVADFGCFQGQYVLGCP